MKEERLKIFVSSYACEPNLGSEIGVGWHWVLEMSKYFDLWVLTRKNNQDSIENWLLNNPVDNKINFIYYDIPKKLRFWKKGLRGVRTYYILWQKLSNRLVKQTMMENSIEIFHLLTYGNALWPISNYGQKKSFVWGPTGVGDVISAEYSKKYNVKGRLIESVRRLSVKTLPLNRGFHKRCRDAKLIFCKTETAFNSIPEKYRDKAMVFTDVAVERIDTSLYPIEKLESGKLINYYAVGRLDAWRGFDLLIEAFSMAVMKNTDIRLEILGKGPDENRLINLIEKLNMESFITLGGQVSMDDYYQKMSNCDVVVNPCLKEGAVTTAFDSMSFGKPLICIDTGGYTRYFNNDYAVVIPKTSREEVVLNISKGIILLTNRKERIEKGTKAHLIGRNFDWQSKGEQIYKEVVNRFR